MTRFELGILMFRPSCVITLSLWVCRVGLQGWPPLSLSGLVCGPFFIHKLLPRYLPKPQEDPLTKVPSHEALAASSVEFFNFVWKQRLGNHLTGKSLGYPAIYYIFFVNICTDISSSSLFSVPWILLPGGKVSSRHPNWAGCSQVERQLIVNSQDGGEADLSGRQFSGGTPKIDPFRTSSPHTCLGQVGRGSGGTSTLVWRALSRATRSVRVWS